MADILSLILLLASVVGNADKVKSLEFHTDIVKQAVWTKEQSAKPENNLNATNKAQQVREHQIISDERVKAETVVQCLRLKVKS